MREVRGECVEERERGRRAQREEEGRERRELRGRREGERETAIVWFVFALSH